MTSAAAPAAGNAPVGGQQPPDTMTQIIQTLNYIIFFFLFQSIVGTFMQKYAMPPPSANTNNDAAANIMPMNKMENMIQQQQMPYRSNGKPFCLWPQGTVMDLDVIITDSSLPPTGWSLTTSDENEKATMDTSSSSNEIITEGKPNPHRTKVSFKHKERSSPYLASWRQENLILGGLTSDPHAPPSPFSAFFGSSSNQEMNYRNSTLNIPLTETIWNNETHLYAYVRLKRRVYGGQQQQQQVDETRREDVLVKRVELTRHRKRKRKRDGTLRHHDFTVLVFLSEFFVTMFV